MHLAGAGDDAARRARGQGAAGHSMGVLVVDDHQVFAEALALAIDAQDGLGCTGVATTGQRALALADEVRPGAAVIDFDLGGDGVISLIRELRTRHPRLRVLVLTGRTPSGAAVRETLEVGASGLLTKIASLDAVVTAVGTLSDECFTLDHETVRSLCGRELGPQRDRDGRPILLTRRERDILELLVNGVDPQTASARLGITVNTARGYVKNLYSKLGVHNQLELLAVARRRGLLDAGPRSEDAAAEPDEASGANA